MHFTCLSNTGNKWGCLLPAQLNDFGQCRNQHHCHLGTAVVSGCKVEFPNSVSDDSFLLQVVEPDALVLRNQDPAFLADERQPRGILGSRRKVLTMTFVFNAPLHEEVQNGFAVVKVLVKKQNDVFRRRWRPSSAPSGLLLRSVWAQLHTRKRGREQIRAH